MRTRLSGQPASSTRLSRSKAHLSDEQYRLYKMIWQKFVSSQMVPAVFDQTTVEIAAKADKTYDFRVSGSILKFDGYLARKRSGTTLPKTRSCPDMTGGQALAMQSVDPGAEVYRAAASLQRSLAGEGARGAGNWPALDLRLHH